MSSYVVPKALLSAVALAMGGTAVANTSLDATSTGDLFLNIVDTSNDTSFLFDTGISQANFPLASNYSYDLHTDPNYEAFVAASKSTDVFDYSVLSATNTGLTNQTRDTVDFTGTVAPPSLQVSHTNQSGAQTVISQFLTAANAVTSATINSAYLGGSAYWGAALTEGAVSGSLFNVGLAPYSDSTAPGTALAFYSENASNLTTFAGTWDLSGATATTGVLTYSSPSSTVPLPAPLVLLLSGLGCMGVVARRRKTLPA